jgi:hypothetical protein
MKVAVSITRWALLGLFLVLLSCSSGGTGGTGSPVVASGAVTGLGSIVVNGITFDTAGAIIIIDGQPGSAADLRLGQVATVRGTREPGGTVGTAETVIVDHNARGPIDSLDPATKRLVVLGQSVRVDSTTHFGDTPLSALVVGNIVEVNGFADADGVLRATRVEKTQEAFTPGTELELDGTITELDTEQQTFTLQMLRVDFSAAQLLNLRGPLRNGQAVQVKSTHNVVDGVLLADSVEVKDPDLQGNPGQAVERQGIITRVTATDTFEVNGQPVRLTSNTVFERGTAADIMVNVRVEVEGFFDAAGIIIAEEVEFGAGIERQGIITRVTAADTFEVNGQPVRLTPDTVFEGGTAADITVNMRVEVEGFFDAAGVLVALEVDLRAKFEGVITRVTTADTFEVNGQLVRFTPDTVFDGGTADDIRVNVRVEGAGLFAADGVLVATEIEFLP